MSVFNLQAPFQPSGDQPSAISKLVKGLNQGLVYQTLLGVTGSGKTFTMAEVIAKLEKPTLILAPNKTLAAQLYGEMKSFFPNNAVEYFVSYYDYYQPEAYVPSTDTYIAKDASINDHIEQMRLSATRSLLERPDTIIVATVSAIYGLGDPRMYLQMVLHLVQGDVIDQRTILRRLAELQYTRNDLDLQRGRFRVRGDIIDVYPADSDKDAVRIELFDKEIAQLSYLDPLTGKIIRKVSRLTIYPKTHYVTAREKILSAVDEIKRDLQIRLAELKNANKLVEFQRLEERTQYDLAMLEEIGYCQGIENYSRYLSGAAPGEPPPTLFDYLPKNSLLFIDESHVTIPQLNAMYRGDRARKQTLVEYGFRLPAALDNRPLMFEEFSARAPQTIYISATPSAFERAQSDQIVEQVVRPTGLLDPDIEIRPVKTQIDDLLDEVKSTIVKHERVLVTTLTKRLAEDLTDFLTEQQIRVRYLHSDIDTVERVDIIRDFRLGVFDVLVGINLLREGLDLPEVSRVAILDADKEGFLRSETALIQTIGRVARNFHGKAILYADKMTGSMERAICETNRRRDIQKKYNEEHGITPKSVERAVHDVMDSAYGESSVRGRLFGGADSQSKTQAKSKSQFGKTKEKSHEKKLKGEALQKELIRLREKMMAHAMNLEFEDAARIRDEMEHLKK